MNQNLIEKIKYAVDQWLETQDEKAMAPVFVAIAEAYMTAMNEVNTQYINKLQEIRMMVEGLKKVETEFERTEKVQAIKDELNKLS